MDDRVKEYVLDVIGATRDPGTVGLTELRPLVEYGASRAPASSCCARRRRTRFCRPRLREPRRREGPRADTLRHRVILTYRADADGIGPDALIDDCSPPCRCRDSRGGRARGPADRDHHPAPGPGHRGRRILQRVSGPGGRVRRGSGISARRRRPHHRLERDRPARLRLRQALPRGARAHRPLRGRLQRVGRVRHPAAHQARAGARGVRRPGARRGPEQRPGRCRVLHRSAGALRAAPQRPPAGAPGDRRAPGVPAAARGTTWPARSARSSPCSAGGRSCSSSPTFRAGSRPILGRLARRHDVIAVQLLDPRERELPHVGLVALRDAETDDWRWVDTRARRCGPVRAAPGFDAGWSQPSRGNQADLLRLDAGEPTVSRSSRSSAGASGCSGAEADRVRRARRCCSGPSRSAAGQSLTDIPQLRGHRRAGQGHRGRFDRAHLPAPPQRAGSADRHRARAGRRSCRRESGYSRSSGCSAAETACSPDGR